jgi:hypothetical protein
MRACETMQVRKTLCHNGVDGEHRAIARTAARMAPPFQEEKHQLLRYGDSPARPFHVQTSFFICFWICGEFELCSRQREEATMHQRIPWPAQAPHRRHHRRRRHRRYRRSLQP